MLLGKDDARRQFQELAARLSQLAADCQMSEAETRLKFINKYLELLGYDWREVTAEDKAEHDRDKADYVLSAGDKAVVAVEAKALHVPLTDDHAVAVSKYAYVRGIRWGLLTNGREFRVYDARIDRPAPEKEVCRGRLDTDFDAAFDRLWLLARENMPEGHGLAALKDRKEFDEQISDLLTRPESPVVRRLKKDLKEHLKRSVHEREVIDWVRERLLGATPSLAAGPEDSLPKRAKSKSFLASMIDRGLLNPGTTLSATYKGEQHTAVVRQDGKLEVKGRLYRKPSSAASAITGTSVNGWLFWTCDGRTLDELRRQL